MNFRRSSPLVYWTFALMCALSMPAARAAKSQVVATMVGISVTDQEIYDVFSQLRGHTGLPQLGYVRLAAFQQVVSDKALTMAAHARGIVVSPAEIAVARNEAVRGGLQASLGMPVTSTLSKLNVGLRSRGRSLEQVFPDDKMREQVILAKVEAQIHRKVSAPPSDVREREEKVKFISEVRAIANTLTVYDPAILADITLSTIDSIPARQVDSRRNVYEKALVLYSEAVKQPYNALDLAVDYAQRAQVESALRDRPGQLTALLEASKAYAGIDGRRRVDVDTMMAIGDLYLAMRRPDKAVEAYNKASGVAKEPYVHMRLADAFNGMRRMDLANRERSWLAANHRD